MSESEIEMIFVMIRGESEDRELAYSIVKGVKKGDFTNDNLRTIFSRLVEYIGFIPSRSYNNVIGPPEYRSILKEYVKLFRKLKSKHILQYYAIREGMYKPEYLYRKIAQDHFTDWVKRL